MYDILLTINIDTCTDADKMMGQQIKSFCSLNSILAKLTSTAAGLVAVLAASRYMYLMIYSQILSVLIAAQCHVITVASWGRLGLNLDNAPQLARHRPTRNILILFMILLSSYNQGYYYYLTRYATLWIIFSRSISPILAINPTTCLFDNTNTRTI